MAKFSAKSIFNYGIEMHQFIAISFYKSTNISLS